MIMRLILFNLHQSLAQHAIELDSKDKHTMKES